MIQLKCNKKDQETMKERGEAYLCEGQLIMNNSKGQGRKMTKNLLDLIKLAFENQCSFVLQEAKHNNAATLEKKIRSTFERINKLSAITSCKISEQYLGLKIEELRLRCEFEDKKQKEKADRQERQRQERENERERRESEKARRKMEEAEENARRHQEELDQFRREIQQVEGAKRNELQLRIDKLEQQVKQDQRDVEAATANYRRAKAGHIYVVSNVGSFSQRDIYRIFMTRSANEDEYVRGMNPLVPFPFDIHYKIYSEEASDVLTYLHQRFQEQRVNLDNNRRDFFRVPFDEIERVVEEMRQEKEGIRIEEFNRQPHNLEYLRSLSLERKKSQQ
ncbi:DUF4041 domain-containing protein [Leptolyngbya sp. ST-U4]|uniref:DUF4041 domain-containing protein n=1 Tax=Leptolyngbya sp. ST-U4 TaxID=2933912 RepID=UPI003297C855